MIDATASNGATVFLTRMGMEDGCRRLARAFYTRVAGSGELKALFPGKSLRCATEEFAAFLIQFLDGAPEQTQYRWWLSLRESHARFEITESQRSEWLRLMTDALVAEIEDFETRNALARFFGVTSRYVIGAEEAASVDDGELAERWDTQRALDRFAECVATGQDREAISLASRFEPRRSVFLGVLAEMMKAGRDALDEYVLVQVRANSELKDGQYNGRSLLHLAAGYGCFPAVQALLEGGANPNTVDSGGHAPLYRVGPGHHDSGRQIVEALVAAGADVNHAGGTARSTALHQAARFGFVSVAQALLAPGADASRRDKKGFTPLDRARNCRRPEVAALLEG